MSSILNLPLSTEIKPVSEFLSSKTFNLGTYTENLSSLSTIISSFGGEVIVNEYIEPPKLNFSQTLVGGNIVNTVSNLINIVSALVLSMDGTLTLDNDFNITCQQLNSTDTITYIQPNYISSLTLKNNSGNIKFKGNDVNELSNIYILNLSVEGSETENINYNPCLSIEYYCTIRNWNDDDSTDESQTDENSSV